MSNGAPGEIGMNWRAVLATAGSAASIGFGVWHFFVPRIWHWRSYIDPAATELILAVRAVNVFFSLSLVLFGLMNLLLVFGPRTGRYPLVVTLGATCVLWLARVMMQVVYPQGSMSPALQYGMLVAFIAVLACHVVALALVALGRGVA